jgi:hypothetical protein
MNRQIAFDRSTLRRFGLESSIKCATEIPADSSTLVSLTRTKIVLLPILFYVPGLNSVSRYICEIYSNRIRQLPRVRAIRIR